MLGIWTKQAEIERDSNIQRERERERERKKERKKEKERRKERKKERKKKASPGEAGREEE
jgi:hypothetical protein